MKAYLDNGATTRVDTAAIESIKQAMVSAYANPSSLHMPGMEAKEIIENARKTIAKTINAKAKEIIFTSGGTEADNMAVLGIAAARKGRKHIITSQIEHPAVLNACKELEEKGYKVTFLKVDANGFVSPEDVKKAITNDTALVSIMHANNEIGTIEPIKEIAGICAEKKVPLHTDAVQSYKKVPIDVDKMKVSAMSLSAHKIHGPKGVGALYLREGTPFKKISFGGGQENNKRAGTENVPGIAGFAKAAEQEMGVEQIKKLRDYLVKKISKEITDTGINGPKQASRRVCNNANIYFKFIEGESLLMHLSLKGIYVSTGSACSSTSLEISHVLKAIGLKYEHAHGSIRFTLSKYTTKKEIDYTVDTLKEIVKELRRISPLTK